MVASIGLIKDECDAALPRLIVKLKAKWPYIDFI